MDWNAQIDLDHPCWRGYQRVLRALPGQRFPAPHELTAHLLPEARTASGHPVRFVASTELPPEDYEARIWRSGEVSTRIGNHHDLFNALAWIRFPATKSALNARHHAHRNEAGAGRRGAARDALTLFDEGGALLVAASRSDLDAVAVHDWAAVFTGGTEAWRERFRLRVLGHGLLDKCRAPYLEMTANALLLHVSECFFCLSDEDFCIALDRAVAALCERGDVLQSPRDLAPLPLAGISGWWRNDRDVIPRRNRSVFRPRRPGRPPAPVFRLTDYLQTRE